MEIEGKEAIVFGGGSGLGAATARGLAAAGAQVMVADLVEETAREVAAEIAGKAIRCDVTDPESVEAAVAQIGKPRIAVTCAGIGMPAKFVGRDGGATTLDAFAEVVAVNLLGTINVLRVTAAKMAANDIDSDEHRGVCVCAASIAAYDGQIGQVAYAASKGGVVAVTLPLPASSPTAASGS